MMKKGKARATAVFLTAILTTLWLTACGKNNDPDWEDTLPSAVTTTATQPVQIITEETTPPISIEMPEKTTPSETRSTELATTTTSVEEEEEDTVRGSVPWVSEVPVSEFTSTAPSSVSSESTLPPETETVDTTVVYDSVVTESTVDDISTTEVLTSEMGKTYVFEDPISRPYCYGTLNATQRSLYDFVIKGILKHQSKITFPDSISITSEEYAEVYQLIYNNEHSIYYIDTQMKYTTSARTGKLISAELCYIYTQDEINTMQKKIDAVADGIIAQITEDMTEYDIVKLFFDRLVENCVYDVDGKNCRDIYGCFVDGRAVCGGYAKAFSYLCDKVGIQSLTITGDDGDIPHMWNMVKLGGEWYHIDVTSGYVKNAVTPYVRYDYFCVDDACITKSRTIYEQIYTYPVAMSEKYNYYVYNNLVADSWESAKELLELKIIEASTKGETTVQIACFDEQVFNTVVYMLFDRSQAQALSVLDSAYDQCERKYNRESITYNQDGTTGIIKLFLVYLD